ncbi:hypothetical protein BD560DRAFT_486338 [Blakeslea trispora]|nr:hypothetical protein BD560DRAFT_486338 [Blakeslea trispora]
MSNEEDQASKETVSKRPILAKYATSAHGEKKFPTLSSHFDKNLTIEKAKFEGSSSSSTPLPHPPISSTSTPAMLPTTTAVTTTTTANELTGPLTTSVTLPTTAPIGTAIAVPSQSTPLLSKPSNSALNASTKPKVEDRRAMNKRKKLPQMSGTATPSEVFHRNLVDAVSNVEDSDENEQYVYPYSGNNTDTTTGYLPNDPIHRTASSLYRPQSTRSFAHTIDQQDGVNSQPLSQQQAHQLLLQQPHQPSRKKSGYFLGDILKPILFKSKSSTTIRPNGYHNITHTNTNNEEQLARPKLRNFIMDHSTDNFWYSSSDGKHSPPLKRHPGGRRKLYSSYGIHDGGYTTDDEEAQNSLTPFPSRRTSTPSQRKKASLCSRLLRHLAIILITMLITLFLFMTYIAKPLQNLNVDISRVLSSDKELIFDLHINAVNLNFWTVRIADADMSVFAFSQVVPMVSKRGIDPAEYLGGFYHFDEPLSFSSSFYSQEPVTAISQIRIKSPGADRSGNERWSRMIRYPYGLVVRGVLKYRPLGFLSPYPQSIAICDVVRVDPTIGKISKDPDQGFCLSYGENSK